jgi:hypothetical protein
VESAVVEEVIPASVEDRPTPAVPVPVVAVVLVVPVVPAVLVVPAVPDAEAVPVGADAVARDASACPEVVEFVVSVPARLRAPVAAEPEVVCVELVSADRVAGECVFIEAADCVAVRYWRSPGSFANDENRRLRSELIDGQLAS